MSLVFKIGRDKEGIVDYSTGMSPESYSFAANAGGVIQFPVPQGYEKVLITPPPGAVITISGISAPVLDPSTGPFTAQNIINVASPRLIDLSQVVFEATGPQTLYISSTVNGTMGMEFFKYSDGQQPIIEPAIIPGIPVLDGLEFFTATKYKDFLATQLYLESGGDLDSWYGLEGTPEQGSAVPSLAVKPKITAIPPANNNAVDFWTPNDITLAITPPGSSIPTGWYPKLQSNTIFVVFNTTAFPTGGPVSLIGADYLGDGVTAGNGVSINQIQSGALQYRLGGDDLNGNSFMSINSTTIVPTGTTAIVSGRFHSRFESNGEGLGNAELFINGMSEATGQFLGVSNTPATNWAAIGGAIGDNGTAIAVETYHGAMLSVVVYNRWLDNIEHAYVHNYLKQLFTV